MHLLLSHLYLYFIDFWSIQIFNLKLENIASNFNLSRFGENFWMSFCQIDIRLDIVLNCE